MVSSNPPLPEYRRNIFHSEIKHNPQPGKPLAWFTFVSCEVSSENDQKTKHGEHDHGDNTSDDGMIDFRRHSICSWICVARKTNTNKLRHLVPLSRGRLGIHWDSLEWLPNDAFLFQVALMSSFLFMHSCSNSHQHFAWWHQKWNF